MSAKRLATDLLKAHAAVILLGMIMAFASYPALADDMPAEASLPPKMQFEAQAAPALPATAEESQAANPPAEPQDQPENRLAEQVDTIRTVDGSNLTGRLVGLEDELLKLDGGAFVGTVSVRLAAVVEVESQSVTNEPGNMTVLLTNGDQLVGRLLAIDQETVTLAGVATQPMRIKRVMVVGMYCGSEENVLLDSRMMPWRAKDQWQRPDRQKLGQLGGRLSGGNTFQADVPHAGSVTLVLDYRSVSAHGPAGIGRRETFSPSFGMALHCLMPDGVRQFAGASITGNTYRFFERSEGGSSSWQSSSSAIRPAAEGEVRLAYDSATRHLTLWANGQQIAQRQVSEFKNGGSVLFSHDNNFEITRTRLLQGVVAPGTENEMHRDEALDIVTFVNNDVLRVQSLGLADNILKLETAFGQLSGNVSNIRSISFRQNADESPRRRKEDIRIRTSQGLITLALMSLDEDTLSGESDAFGRVHVRREFIHSLDFDPHQAKPSDEQAAVPPLPQVHHEILIRRGHAIIDD